MAPAALISTPSPAPRAPTVIGPKTKKATRPTKILPRSLIEGAKVAQKRTFDPAEHLDFQPPEKIHKMADFGLPGAGISPNAISEPFPLFTEEAIQQMRSEIFSEPVLKNCQYASTFCTNMIRGMGHERAPFIYDVFKSPEVLDKISSIAGIDLIPAYDYEIANINVAVKDDPVEGVASNSTSTIKPATADDDTPAFAWHYDSFPFVCVTMLSDCTEMVGGETAIKMPSGDVKKVRGPAMGYAVVMQGRYLEHQALKAVGGRERISMVTPFRPKNPLVRDETILVGVRGISNLTELYPQYFDYRTEVLEERIRHQRKVEKEREIAKKPFDVDAKRAWLEEQREFIDSMLREMYVVE
ncbi:hypothetical protein ASPSYDRAFT_131039 [Aspergillus sydowii CBS 593.65]|uniref:Fe2OG dioxygenase domain-containing protein n=1 Tax=Aspergillus sydowii CBS 593.65 TaxID=1036612 RepID=A0A1L9TPX3_9EURO|nr:uncharacterized protein ASPSYDRAFT_131039 [Aspergillus sydowii CBS 593.65]OJJ61489.1 hypothetical protein ASPSYDRAFT_131039 [Aspergillus sydowii CBS 593.65]